jgi:threonine aldolase
MKPIDLRSDTVTQPTLAMCEAMLLRQGDWQYRFNKEHL